MRYSAPIALAVLLFLAGCGSAHRTVQVKIGPAQIRAMLRDLPGTASSAARCLQRHGWTVERHGSTFDLRRGHVRYELHVGGNGGSALFIGGSTPIPKSVNDCIVP